MGHSRSGTCGPTFCKEFEDTTDTGKDTTVVIVGGGVAGLALGNFLLQKGVGCIVLEKHSREYVEQRQRAGALDAGGVRVLNEWGGGRGCGGLQPRRLRLGDAAADRRSETAVEYGR
ncbi:FAD-dependent monooxygenase [Streptomyces sp. NPDC020125]|uniref:FAD-dependent monooxygenase n=1 Tax=Streptomyces sp. NPDC020125 TaxID=3154593 RepID=UPI0033F7EAA2